MRTKIFQRGLRNRRSKFASLQPFTAVFNGAESVRGGYGWRTNRFRLTKKTSFKCGLGDYAFFSPPTFLPHLTRWKIFFFLRNFFFFLGAQTFYQNDGNKNCCSNETTLGVSSFVSLEESLSTCGGFVKCGANDGVDAYTVRFCLVKALSLRLVACRQEY